jgi:hypothetical protein
MGDERPTARKRRSSTSLLFSTFSTARELRAVITGHGASCTSCGESVGPDAKFCTRCGEPVDRVTGSTSDAVGVQPEPDIASLIADSPELPIKRPTARVTGSHRSGGDVLSVLGLALVLVGLILFFAKAGFPPSFTTTYSYSPTGGVTQTTSPGYGVVGASLVLVLVGGGLAKAGKARR